MIVIHCRDSWSTIVMMIVLSDYRDSSRHDIKYDFLVCKAYFMEIKTDILVLETF